MVFFIDNIIYILQYRYIYIVVIISYNMKLATITIRIYYRDWLRLRRMFKGRRNESAASYIERVVREIEKLK